MLMVLSKICLGYIAAGSELFYLIFVSAGLWASRWAQRFLFGDSLGFFLARTPLHKKDISFSEF